MPASATERIAGGSDAARLIASTDWSASSLGPIECWPDALVLMLNMVLAAPVPMQIFWGSEFLCLYNDAMTPALSIKHPASMGQSARVVWAEAWDAIGPQMEQVLHSGVACAFDRALVPLLRDGTLQERYWTYSYSAIFDASGAIAGVLDVAQDVTDAAMLELSLRQTEKLAAVGQLASTIAHEINNPLEAITNLLYLSRATATEPETIHYLGMAEIELRRVSAIVTQTLRFHRQRTARTELACIDLLNDALLIFQGRIENAGIRVEKRKRADRTVFCLEGEIRQVMNNLIGNAIDAMTGSGGGRLMVRSADATDWRTGRQGVRMTVADTGAGMSAETRAKLFEPFFTTKGFGGTGLGLWISHEIVERHHGRLMLRSSQRPGRHGTVFALFLPG